MQTSQPSLEQVILWAKQAGKIAKDGFTHEHQIGFKTPTDVVTEVDHACEKLIMENILSCYPGHSILTEESGSIQGDSDHCWYIDPLDGTINYSHRLPIYAVSIAYAVKGVVQLGVIYDPSLDECFSAERGKGAWLNGQQIHVSKCKDLQKSLLSTGFPHGKEEEFAQNLRAFGYLTNTTQGVRRMGSAAVDICAVACGRLDAYWEQSIHAWDIAAGTLIVEEAGGTVTSLQGDRDYFKPPYAVIAAAPGIHQELFEILQKL